MSYTKAEDVCPQEGRQTELFRMIANQEADFYMIGGSRFGGKSEVISMVDLLFADGNPAGVKKTLELLGICSQELRLPLVPANQDVQAAITQAVSKIKVLTPIS